MNPLLATPGNPTWQFEGEVIVIAALALILTLRSDDSEIP